MAFELRLAEGRDRGRRFRFDVNEVTIGRAAENDLVVHDIRASRSHARIRAGNAGYALLDDASCNGTHVNGRATRGTTQLRSGDRIRVGSTTFEFSSGPRGSAFAAASGLRRIVGDLFLSWPLWARGVALVAGAAIAVGVFGMSLGRRASRNSRLSDVAAVAADPTPRPATPAARTAEELFAGATADVRAAREAYERGRRKLDERRIAPRNLYDAWRAFDSAARSARGLLPPHADAELRRLVEWAERELDTQCKRLLFGAARFERYGDDARAQVTYREAMLHFPGDDPSGCRKKAQENLVAGDDGANPAVGVFGYPEAR